MTTERSVAHGTFTLERADRKTGTAGLLEELGKWLDA